ncbi:hypothetical protein J7E71_03580 [Mesobacillus foraminis]|uniref:hypothetical protein n=1 Tax=Mesobacillus foraminis TaxID=279826 RepID=UPI001BEB7E58|nr:hypothetical protein [Mesobacillus foraminis]MBT2755032.1 hypothetical protein [Mesobacillus foraminis]
MQYHPQVQLLLISHSTEKERVLYDQNSHPYLLPKIGPRPPFYWNPRYEPFFPKI